MKIQTLEKKRIVSELLTANPDLPSLTLAKILFKKHAFLFPTMDSARGIIRYYRGNCGKGMRHLATHKRPNQPAGFVWQFPKSSAPSYIPFVLDAARTLVLSDLHIPFHDTAAIQAVIEKGKTFKPDCILLNGDVCDFFSVSRFDRNPTESSLKNELNLTRQFLGWLRQTFPKARIIYKLGNHDEWFEKYLWRKAVELYGVAGISLQHLTTGKIDTIEAVEGIEWVDDQRKITIGKLNVWHGHEIGRGSIAPPVNPARGLFMRTMESGIMGHLHKRSSHDESTANGKLVATWSTGCLCGLWPRYARVNKWNHSAAVIELNRGQFNVQEIRVLDGKVL